MTDSTKSKMCDIAAEFKRVIMLNKDKVLKMYLDKDFCSNMSNKVKNMPKMVS